ncbi:MAG: hypothetical protein MMC33_000809 [Icmadophila ericetorum]|nr:hypothetical protein [Icmadophila ericetorum]
MSTSQETLRRAFEDRERPMVSFGLPFPEACLKHINETFHASKIYIICSGTLAKKTTQLKDLQKALGGKVVGLRIGMTSHTLLSEILEVVQDAKKFDPELIVTLGGGSLTDAAKIIAVALANNVSTREGLLALPSAQPGTLYPTGTTLAPKIPIISIPTTLSGGEYSDFSGSTDDLTNVKTQFAARGPAFVILDGSLALNTPLQHWLPSGIRAVDHCIESLCSLGGTPETDRMAIRGLERLMPSLLRCKRDAEGVDADARRECQLGVIDAMGFFTKKVQLGASHGIGHMLGPLGVGHGETSCILLPAVCKYNAAKGANVEKQDVAKKVLWGIGIVSEVLRKSGLREGEADLGDALDAILRELGMPRSLGQVGVGKDQFETLAVNSLRDPWLGTNPSPLTTKEQVLEILEACA